MSEQRISWEQFQAKLAETNGFKGWWCSHLRWWPPGPGQTEMVFVANSTIEKVTLCGCRIEVSLSRAYIKHPFLDKSTWEMQGPDRTGTFQLDGVPGEVDEIYLTDGGSYKIVGDKTMGYHYTKECQICPPDSFKEEDFTRRG